MPSPGKPRTSAERALDARQRETGTSLLSAARQRERAGCMPEAMTGYEAAVACAEQENNGLVLAEALRRLAILRHHQGESDLASALCLRSLEVSHAINHELLAAEALNTLGGVMLATGRLEEARARLLEAVELGGKRREHAARAEQNLGILANIQGDFDEAMSRYRRSLEAYDAARNEHGCAIAYNNLGMVSADRGQWDKAHRYFRESRAIAERVGDPHLRALSLVNEAEVDASSQRYEQARQAAEEALSLFEQLGAQGAKSDAYRVIGVVYRETGRHSLAESRLHTAVDVAAAAGSVLIEAEACRELALLFQQTGRNHDALVQLDRSYRLFSRLDARCDLVYVAGKLAELEGTYLAVVRDWGRSLESNDQATFGHCERVARTAVAVARTLGLDAHAETTILLGAYLHDVGMMKVPHEIVSKAGSLTTAERDLVELHPVFGVELLAEVSFPWDLKPVIRWHHERCDGSGYPDRLKGEDIPVTAQVVGIAECFDALTTGRTGEALMTEAQALERFGRCRAWWSDPVVDAFLTAMAQPQPAVRLTLERVAMPRFRAAQNTR